VTVVFIDLRRFTAFAETAEPEEIMGGLREYHAAMGRGRSPEMNGAGQRSIRPSQTARRLLRT
jgi:class 3 adenylate cyclase